MIRRAAALLTVLAVGACGGADEEVTQRLERAAERSQQVRDLRGTMVLEAAGPGEHLVMNGPFEASGDGRLMRLRARFEQRGEGAFRMEVIVVGAEQYLRGGSLTEALPAGKRWFHAKDTGPQTLSFADFLDFLRDSEDMKEAGVESVLGEETSRYSGDLDLAALAERGGGDVDELLAGADPDDIDGSIDVWLDDEDLVRRMRVRFGAGGDSMLDADMLVKAYDVGLRIDAPDPAVVAELPAG